MGARSRTPRSPRAVSAAAAVRPGPAGPDPKVPAAAAPARLAFDLGRRLTRDTWTQPYVALQDRQESLAGVGGHARGAVQRVHRKLRVYTQDPSTPRARQPVAECVVPFEPLQAGPIGSVILVDDTNETRRETYVPVDLDDLSIAAMSGLRPSTTNPGFAQQMTYALAMTTYERFRLALGRPPQFAFDAHPGDEIDGRTYVKLHIHPHAIEEDNAWYDPDRGALCFGYTTAAAQALGLDQPGGRVFTALSHDVVVHEMTHALLDGMRAQFMLPTSPDVDGFHEGFSDLIALFQRFTYRDVVQKAITETRGALTSRLLVELARQFGAATGDGRTPLRTALAVLGDLDDPVPAKHRYRPDLEAHDMGAVLLGAVFDAFRYVFDEKTARLRSLVPASGAMPDALVELLTREASRLAEQFATICIRAIDYCPPVDLRLGEYLRALVTADYDIVPDDPWGYREALVRGFRRHGITVDEVQDLSEEALLWEGPEAYLVFELLPAKAGLTPQAAQREYAMQLGKYVTEPENLCYFGLAPANATKGIGRPVIESVRPLRRVGPDGTVNDDFVAEILQRRKVRDRWMHGGATVIFSREGVIRYVIVKSVTSRRREARITAHLEARPHAARYFGDVAPPPAARLRRLHRARRGSHLSS